MAGLDTVLLGVKLFGNAAEIVGKLHLRLNTTTKPIANKLITVLVENRYPTNLCVFNDFQAYLTKSNVPRFRPKLRNRLRNRPKHRLRHKPRLRNKLRHK